MANAFTAGENVELSGTGVSGEYALLNESMMNLLAKGGKVTWYIEHVLGSGGTNVTLAAYCKEIDISSSIYFVNVYETNGGTLQGWTTGAISASSTNAAYTVPYPKGCRPALLVTFSGGSAQTLKISAKVAA
jgi:hypothetical protein